MSSYAELEEAREGAWMHLRAWKRRREGGRMGVGWGGVGGSGMVRKEDTERERRGGKEGKGRETKKGTERGKKEGREGKGKGSGMEEEGPDKEVNRMEWKRE